MSELSAGNMLLEGFKKVIATILKMIVLVLAWCFELVGKLFLKVSEVIKNNSK
jgi:hypothetical protein